MAIYFKNGIEISDDTIASLRKVRQFRRKRELQFGPIDKTDEEMLSDIYKIAVLHHIEAGVRQYAQYEPESVKAGIPMAEEYHMPKKWRERIAEKRKEREEMAAKGEKSNDYSE